jgi:phosphotriesterase-related protein
MNKIRTVLGDILPEQLGFTYSHEHLWCSPPDQQPDRDFELMDYDKSLEELKHFKEIGGQSLVEGSAIDYGRNAHMLAKMSEESGVNVVATTGFNKHVYYPDWVNDKSIDEIENILVKDLTQGIDDTDIKAGYIKVGSWLQLIHPLEEKTTIAAAHAQRKTGAPVWMHTEAGTMGVEMLEILQNGGADLSKVVVGHSDRNPDPYYHLQLAKTGAYVQFDGCGKIKYGTDYVRIELLKNLIQHGFQERILISGDMGRKSYLSAYGGGPGFRYIKTKFIPRMIEEGISADIIHTIFVENPARWLAQF